MLCVRTLESKELRAVFLTLLFLVPANVAHAIVAVTAYTGGAFSILTPEGGKGLTGNGYTLGASMQWHPGKGDKLDPFVLGLIVKQTKISYVEDAINKRGTYLGFGPQIGFSKSFSDSVSVQLLAEYYTAPTLTTVSSNTVSLNGETFRYSTWQSFKGGSAVGARLAIVHDKLSGQFSKKNRFRSGVALSYSSQSFTQSTTEVTSSKSLLAPSVSSTTEEISTAFALFTADLFLGITF